jgi:acetylornithine deacetylase
VGERATLEREHVVSEPVDLSDPFELLARWVDIPSITGDEGAYAGAVAEVLAAEGLAVELQEVAPGRPNLVARPPDRTPEIVFSTHLDVVPPHLPARREGDRLYGRGTADTKGPLVAMLLAARQLMAEGVGVGFLLVVGEEVDHCGALAAADALDLGQPTILLGEPTSNRVVAAQKGMLKVRAKAAGVAGHSAFPDRGVSAVHRLLTYLERVRSEPWPSDPVLGDTTLNVGTIAGGVAANVFAPEAEAQLMFRLAGPVVDAEARLRALLPEGVVVERISGNDPVRLPPPEGFDTCVIPFNSDAGYLESLGRVVLCGPGAIEVAHSDHEHIDLASLNEGAETYVRLARAVRGG